MKQDVHALLFGASGYLGRVLTARLQQFVQVVPTYRGEASLANAHKYDFWVDDIRPLLDQQRIDIVVIAASMAYKVADPTCDCAVFRPKVEEFVRACRACRVVYISSDGIFDGEQGGYRETVRPTPSTPYGRNLLYFEETVQRLCPDYCIVRPSYLFGYSFTQLDRRLSQVRARLLAGEQVISFTNMFKSPMEVNQVADAITQLTLGDHFGIVHVGGPVISIYDFYREAMLALDVPCDQLYPTQVPGDFSHPRDTSLDNRLMRELTGIKPMTVNDALIQG